ncbi:MAG: flagellin [Fidelibacterota bacterium]
MRITEGMISRNLLTNINSSREKMAVYQNQTATGKKLEKVSDDPVDYTKVESFRNAISNNSQYLEGINLAKGWIDVSMTGLDQINEGLMTAKEIAIRAADISNNGDNWETFRDQINDIIEDTVSLSNSTFMGKAVFAGTKSKTDKAFIYNDNSITYTGNDKKINRKIADNYYVDINTTGQELIETEAFDNLINFKNALDNGDTDAITKAIDLLDDSSAEIGKRSAAIGSAKIQIVNTENRLNTANVNLKSYLSNLEDADMAEAITNYKNEETAYQAALHSTSNAINLNILNFLR